MHDVGGEFKLPSPRVVKMERSRFNLPCVLAFALLVLDDTQTWAAASMPLTCDATIADETENEHARFQHV